MYHCKKYMGFGMFLIPVYMCLGVRSHAPYMHACIGLVQNRLVDYEYYYTSSNILCSNALAQV